MIRRLLPALLSLLALCAVVGATAGAQSGAAPQPTCTGLAAKDAAADSANPGPLVNVSTGAGPANLEILGFWFDTVGAKTTANIQVKNLSKDVPDDNTGVSWYVEWTVDDAIKFVSVQSDGAAYTYNYGTLIESLYQADGDTSGKAFEGENGVLQIVIPAEAGGSKGKKLTEPAATAFEETSVMGTGSLGRADRAPDEGGGKTYTVAACEGASAPAPGPVGTPPAPGATPAPGGGTGSQPGSSRVVSQGTLAVKAAASLGSAKKAAKKKSTTVKLTSTGKVTKLTALLFTGKLGKPKVFGKGTLATLDKKGTLKLKLSKKPKKGSYFLYLEGDQADGKRHSKQYKVTFKK